jgi:hypothetical protein
MGYSNGLHLVFKSHQARACSTPFRDPFMFGTACRSGCLRGAGLPRRNAHPSEHAPLKLGHGLPSGLASRRRLAAPQRSPSETCTTQVGLRLAPGLASRRRLAAPLRHSIPGTTHACLRLAVWVGFAASACRAAMLVPLHRGFAPGSALALYGSRFRQQIRSLSTNRGSSSNGQPCQILAPDHR